MSIAMEMQMTVQNLGTIWDGGSETPLYMCWEPSWQVGGEGAEASAIGRGWEEQ